MPFSSAGGCFLYPVGSNIAMIFLLTLEESKDKICIDASPYLFNFQYKYENDTKLQFFKDKIKNLFKTKSHNIIINKQNIITFVRNFIFDTQLKYNITDDDLMNIIYQNTKNNCAINFSSMQKYDKEYLKKYNFSNRKKGESLRFFFDIEQVYIRFLYNDMQNQKYYSLYQKIMIHGLDMEITVLEEVSRKYNVKLKKGLLVLSNKDKELSCFDVKKEKCIENKILEIIRKDFVSRELLKDHPAKKSILTC